MSLYADYILERENKLIVEDHRGFAVYSFVSEDQCYIQDIYVHPTYREYGIASSFANQIAQMAKERGCTKLLGSVCPEAKNSTESMQVLLAYGFKLASCKDNFILFIKELV
jgi:GNAT superfamily N-acetyltransferase